MFRKLYAEEIELRAKTATASGMSVLLYKDARCDMSILDETVGAKNWKREHLRNNANCVVSIWCDDKKEWVSKEDTGTESNTEAEKGLASDSFKRACVNWGIGRELYTAPKFIWLSVGMKTNNKGKYERESNEPLFVSKITYTESGLIDELEISEGKELVFVKGKYIAPKKTETKKQEPVKMITDEQFKKLTNLPDDRHKSLMDGLARKGIENLKQLTFEQATKLVEGI